jgi:hypothetical protein
MRPNPTMMLLSSCLLLAFSTLTAADPVLDCGTRSGNAATDLQLAA